MPHSYPLEMRRQIVELARAGTKAKQLAATFRMSDPTIYNWLKQERIDRVRPRTRPPASSRNRQVG
jgi:transposase